MNPREAFFDSIYEYAASGEDVVVVTPDLAAPSLDKFRRDFPEKCISVGIAEQNLIQVSTGLAREGKKVVAWGLNPFVVSRGYDQIRNTVSLMGIPLTIAGLHTGLSSAVSGPSHVVITDLSLIRTLPDIICINPADCLTAKEAAKLTILNKKAVYVRFDKDISCENIGYKSFDPECGVETLHQGKDKTAVLVTGYHTKEVLDLLPQWNSAGIDPRIVNAYAFPFDHNALANAVSGIEKIVIIEEHVIQGGFGSAVFEALAEKEILIKARHIGIDAAKGYPEWFGWRTDLQKHFGLDPESIYNYILEQCK